MKLLREKYKTWEGADRRARFENGCAESEFRNGCKARLYRYKVVVTATGWAVERKVAETTNG